MALTMEGRLLSGRLGSHLSDVCTPGRVRDISLNATATFFCAVLQDGSRLWCGSVDANGAHWTVRGENFTSSPVWSADDNGSCYLAVFRGTRALIHECLQTSPISEINLTTRPCVAAWSHASPVLAIGHEDGSLLFARPDGKRLYSVVVSSGPVTCLFWNANGRTLVVGTDKFVHVLSLTGRMAAFEVQLQSCVPAPAHCGAYRPRGKVFATGCPDGTVLLCKPGMDNSLKLLSRTGGSIEALSWSPNGKRLAVANATGEIRVLRVCR
ncbi:MAG TPA: WD40 repeat domain-containing protein [Bryobacteraceae bacterium]|nr:WD40 repeat domain-containing protein [Bryobacteraceae bacterium]